MLSLRLFVLLAGLVMVLASLDGPRYNYNRMGTLPGKRLVSYNRRMDKILRKARDSTDRRSSNKRAMPDILAMQPAESAFFDKIGRVEPLPPIMS